MVYLIESDTTIEFTSVFHSFLGVICLLSTTDLFLELMSVTDPFSNYFKHFLRLPVKLNEWGKKKNRKLFIPSRIVTVRFFSNNFLFHLQKKIYNFSLFIDLLPDRLDNSFCRLFFDFFSDR